MGWMDQVGWIRWDGSDSAFIHWLIIGSDSIPSLLPSPPPLTSSSFSSGFHWLQSSFRAISEQFQSNFRAISGRFCKRLNNELIEMNEAVPTPVQFQCSFRAVSEQFQSNFRAVSEQFRSNLGTLLIFNEFDK